MHNILHMKAIAISTDFYLLLFIEKKKLKCSIWVKKYFLNFLYSLSTLRRWLWKESRNFSPKCWAFFGLPVFHKEKPSAICTRWRDLTYLTAFLYVIFFQYFSLISPRRLEVPIPLCWSRQFFEKSFWGECLYICREFWWNWSHFPDIPRVAYYIKLKFISQWNMESIRS